MSVETEPASFPLWGGTASVVTADPAALPAALDAVRAVCDAFDLACSLFRADSELIALNRRAGKGPVRTSSLLLDAISAALRGLRLSGGAVDPTVGGATVRLNGRARQTFSLGVSARAVSIDRAEGTITLPAGVSLDLGATAKALAADRAAVAAHVASRSGVLVALLGDLACAGAPSGDGWPVRVTADHRRGDAAGQTITLRSGGLATSSLMARGAHILDPQTGEPVRPDLAVASVAAVSCLYANIASTTALVRGNSCAAWLAARGLPARLVRRDGSVVRVAGWPADGEELPDAPPVRAAA